MEVLHHLSLRADEADRREIDRLAIKLLPLRNVPPGLVVFDISESDESWPAVQEWATRRGLTGLVWTKFTKQEVSEARWLALVPEWHHGYPQPNAGNDGYVDVSYDLADSCGACRMGRRQKAPFRMSGEPRWGKRGILQLNWVFDQYFVTPEVWATVFEPRGVGSYPVLSGRGAELQTVVQLVVEERVSLQVAGYPSETCALCGRIRYLPIVRGPVPPPISEPVGHMARTDDWFGSGGRSFHTVLVSQDLARAIQAAHVRGVDFTPVAAASDTADR